MHGITLLATTGRLFASEYYIVSLLILATYSWVRLVYRDTEVNMYEVNWDTFFVSQDDPPKAPTMTDFKTWEWQFFGAFVLTGFWRIHRSCSSADSTCFTILGYSQVFVTLMAFLVSNVLFAHYAIAFTLAYLLLEQPGYAVKNEVEVFTPLALQERAKAAEPAGIAYLIFMHARWSLACHHAYSTFAQLACRYSTDRIVFAKLDLSEWPHLSAKLGIDVSPSSWQLPTVILYENGEEQLRLPRKKSKELSKDVIVRACELDMRLAVSMQRRARQE